MSDEDLPPRLKGLEWDGKAPADLGAGGFLRLKRHQVRHRHADGLPGPWYGVESVWPPFADAVVLLLHDQPGGSPQRVLLRRAMRPAVYLRNLDAAQHSLDEAEQSGLFWELPAGGVEPGDLTPEGGGLRGRASAEAWEEAGHRVSPEAWRPLGPPPFSLPAFCTERLHYYAAVVEPALGQAPRGDGHPMEEGALVRWLDLEEALLWCRQGRILDTKTELGLHRLRESLSAG